MSHINCYCKKIMYYINYYKAVNFNSKMLTICHLTFFRVKSRLGLPFVVLIFVKQGSLKKKSLFVFACSTVTTPEDASHSGLFNFLNSATENVSDLNASVLVLVLGVAAHLVSMTTLSTDQWQRVTSLYDVVQSSAVGENSSVGAAYYKSLASVAGCPRGLEWLEKNSSEYCYQSVILCNTLSA